MYSAGTQTALKQTTKAGQIAGLVLTGWSADRFGYRKTQLAALGVLALVVLFQFLAPSTRALIAAQTLVGVPLAPFLTISNVYASEVSPLRLRPYLTTFQQLCWVGGGLISTGILRGFVNNTSQWAYRIPFAIQWCWMPLIALVCLTAPESPTWLIKRGRIDDARRSLQRLSGKKEDSEALEDRLAYLQYTNELEKVHSHESVSYSEVFKGTNLRRTEIACAVYSIQPLCGYGLGYNSTYFFEQAGLTAASAFDVSLGVSALALVCCLVSWPLMRWYGRRPMILIGLLGALCSMFLIGGFGIPRPQPWTGWATGGACFFFTIAYSITIGPLVFTIITDIPSTRLRAKTAALARASYIATTLFNVIVTNYQANETAWDWRGKAGFFWAGSCILCLVWAFFRLPETKDKAATEIDALFEEGRSARDF